MLFLREIPLDESAPEERVGTHIGSDPGGDQLVVRPGLQGIAFALGHLRKTGAGTGQALFACLERTVFGCPLFGLDLLQVFAVDGREHRRRGTPGALDRGDQCGGGVAWVPFAQGGELKGNGRIAEGSQEFVGGSPLDPELVQGLAEHNT